MKTLAIRALPAAVSATLIAGVFVALIALAATGVGLIGWN